MKILTIIVILVEVLLFLISATASHIVSWGPILSEFELVFYTVLLIGLYISSSLFLFRSDITTLKDETQVSLKRIVDAKGLVEAIEADEFHERFRRSAAFAKSAVLMSHLDTEPPTKKGLYPSLAKL